MISRTTLFYNIYSTMFDLAQLTPTTRTRVITHFLFPREQKVASNKTSLKKSVRVFHDVFWAEFVLLFVPRNRYASLQKQNIARNKFMVRLRIMLGFIVSLAYLASKKKRFHKHVYMQRLIYMVLYVFVIFSPACKKRGSLDSHPGSHISIIWISLFYHHKQCGIGMYLKNSM